MLANEFDSAIKTELRILKDSEDTLRELGPISDDLEIIAEQLKEHKVFSRAMVTILDVLKKNLLEW